MNNILGVVMAGGFSSRMGTDKAMLLTPEGNTWILKQFGLLSSFFTPSIISVRQNQDYNKHLPDALYIPDEEIAAGPLRGILSVHRQHPLKHLFVVAVDLPSLDKDTISKLLNHFRENPDADLVVFKGEFYEPLCAIYSSRFLNSIQQRLQLNELKSFSLQDVIEHAEHKIVLPITENEIFPLKNINSPE